MILDFILDLIGALLEFAWTDRRPTRRQRVKRALRLSRRKRLSVKHREFSRRWLKFGLDNISDLRLESREPELKTTLERVQQSQDGQR